MKFHELADNNRLDQYRKLAREQYAADGSIEFDDYPLVSESEEGAYVAAWVWVYRPEATKDNPSEGSR